MIRNNLSGPVLDVNTDESVSRIHRRIFSDPRIFELEMRHLFEGGWIFLALENQMPEPHDYMLTRIGRHEILVSRDRNGNFGAFYNTCPHRGARVCNKRSGNSRLHVCPYHGWSFDSAGQNRAIKGKATGAYSQRFLSQDHGLYPIARIESYRGLLFGSLAEEVPDLREYLGEAAKLIDLTLDQSEGGIELLPGSITYTYRANWKLQLENASDGYHVTSTHPTYLRIAADRSDVGDMASGADGVWERTKVFSEDHAEGSQAGSFGFDYGHALVWGATPINAAHPLFERKDSLEARVGAARTRWMFNARNLTIFPNLQVAENFASTLRIIRPLTPELTEMQTYCMAPIGEGAAARRQRIRQYEDFFNPSGLATPDDIAAYESCQAGHTLQGTLGWLQGYERGLAVVQPGASEAARSLGLNPAFCVTGTTQLNDETIFMSYYRAWDARLGEEVGELLARAPGELV